MDDKAPADSHKQEPLSEAALREKEFLLKEREVSLKELETRIQLEIQRRNVWFSSPLLIGVVSTVFGLIGTAFGAAFQGYLNFQLERQKFEFALIQKSLENENKLIANKTDRKEAARRLLFLANSGVLKSLDSNSIKRSASEPEDLPTFPQTSNLRRRADFSCQIIDGVPTTIITFSNLDSISFIQWKNGLPKKGLSPNARCIRASNSFQQALSSGTPFITEAIVGGDRAVCTASSEGAPCKDVLFTVDDSVNLKHLFKEMFERLAGEGSSPIVL
jgi:hypothetical protein